MFLLTSSSHKIAEILLKFRLNTNQSINTDITLALAANDQTLSIGGNIHAFNYYLK
jgi:hypothetical protein